MSLSEDGLAAAAPLLSASAFKPLRHFAKGLGDELTRFWLRSNAELLHSPTSHGFMAVQGRLPLGLLVYSDNPWETSLLGKRAAVINTFVVGLAHTDSEEVILALLDHALRHADDAGVQFLHGKTYTDNAAIIHAFESRGFRLMDTMVDCYFDYRRIPFDSLPRPVLSDGVTVRSARPSDCNELVALSGRAFREHFGRFHADERIGRELATRAYEQWIRSSMDGYADWIHVAELGGKLVGFSTWKRPSPLEGQLEVRVGHLSLVGIDPDYRRQRLFSALIYEGMQSLHGIADIVEAPTHVNNYGMQLGCSKMRWHVLSDARHSFHKWR